MIHPNAELRFISQAIGYGVFATVDIPEGTITYVKDSLEMVISPTDYLMHAEPIAVLIDIRVFVDDLLHRFCMHEVIGL
ncbi:MAG: hypothetical protein RIC80_05905 [Cyclobacteriaceae bacterium]